MPGIRFNSPLLNGMQQWGAQPNPQYGGIGSTTPPIDYGLMQGDAPAPGLNFGGGGAPASVNIGGGMGGQGMPAQGGGFLGSFLNQYNDNGKMTGQGWGAPALGAAQGLFSAYMGMKQYGLMKDQLSESKRQFGLNFDAQKNTTNAQLEDRQKARVASNPGAYESVDSYMDKYKVKG